MIAVNIEKKLKTYGGQQTIKVSAEFAAGSVTKMHGPSGAGKTTFLKIIAGLVNAEKGLIIFNGDVWLDTDKGINLSPQNRQTGFVFQDYALFPNMTVLRHLQYATNDEAWIQRLLELGKLGTFAGHKPIYLSGGQQQRLAILRALATKPKLLLMDEPFSALDKQTKADFITGLKQLFAELGTTVLIVSHNLQELKALDGVEMYIGE
ncbi:MAG: ATP-binding cassette domain-containing protein [Mucilaginibacter sp.]